jgi:hypothetical protein
MDRLSRLHVRIHVQIFGIVCYYLALIGNNGVITE